MLTFDMNAIGMHYNRPLFETIQLTIPDMNNPRNLEFYTQILLFKNDISRECVLFRYLSSSEQRDLQFLAHSLSLEFEYSVATKTTKISRQVPQEIEVVRGLEDTGLDAVQTPNHIISGINLESDFEFLDFTHDAGNADLEGESVAGHLTNHGGFVEHSTVVDELPSDIDIDLDQINRELDSNYHDLLMQELSDISTSSICTKCHPYKDRIWSATLVSFQAQFALFHALL
jgi:hypothetical protein